jgi:hypothetical protein
VSGPSTTALPASIPTGAGMPGDRVSAAFADGLSGARARPSFPGADGASMRVASAGRPDRRATRVSTRGRFTSLDSAPAAWRFSSRWRKSRIAVGPGRRPPPGRARRRGAWRRCRPAPPRPSGRRARTGPADGRPAAGSPAAPAGGPLRTGPGTRQCARRRLCRIARVMPGNAECPGLGPAPRAPPPPHQITPDVAGFPDIPSQDISNTNLGTSNFVRPSTSR